MKGLTQLCKLTKEILDILVSEYYSDSEKIEELVSMGYDYDDIIELALMVEKGKV